MVIDSTAKCVHTYPTDLGDVNIVPGRNLIRDDVGRLLMKSKPFQDMIHSKALGFQKTIVITIPPAEDPATAKAQPGGATPATPPEGETAVSGMNVRDAIAVINECRVVDQLQDIQLRDPRAGVKKACMDRIKVLAAEAESDKPAGEGEDEDDDQDDE